MSKRPTGSGVTDEVFEEWQDLVVKVHDLAEQHGWPKAEVSRRSGVPQSTLGAWFAGTYNGRYDKVNESIQNWLSSIGDMQDLTDRIPLSPAFVKTRFSHEMTDLLAAAQTMPTIVMVNAEAGMGKTFTAKHYARSRSNTWLATISPHTRTVNGMLVEISDALDIHQPNPTRLVRSIGRRLERVGSGSLLIVDEAQNLVDDGINQLRHFYDLYGCGIAILGNSETYHRFGKSWAQNERYGQLRRRIFKRMHRKHPLKSDIEAILDAWGIVDPAQRKFLIGVGMKPGALGQIDQTIKLAKMSVVGQTFGEERALTVSDLKNAWSNRDVEAA